MSKSKLLLKKKISDNKTMIKTNKYLKSKKRKMMRKITKNSKKRRRVKRPLLKKKPRPQKAPRNPQRRVRSQPQPKRPSKWPNLQHPRPGHQPASSQKKTRRKTSSLGNFLSYSVKSTKLPTIKTEPRPFTQAYTNRIQNQTWPEDTAWNMDFLKGTKPQSSPRNSQGKSETNGKFLNSIAYLKLIFWM